MGYELVDYVGVGMFERRYRWVGENREGGRVKLEVTKGSQDLLIKGRIEG